MPDDIDPHDLKRLLADRQRDRDQLWADMEDRIADLEARQQKRMNLVNTGAVATVTITGLTLAAVFAFSGAVWANPSTPMLRVCADALPKFGTVFIVSMLTYMTELLAGFMMKSVSEQIFSKKSMTFWFMLNLIPALMIAFTLIGYIFVGMNTLRNVAETLRNEATLYNNEGTGKSVAPAGEPAELKPLGEFRPPSWIKN